MTGSHGVSGERILCSFDEEDDDEALEGGLVAIVKDERRI
jgi:hypothetical protein